MEVTKEYTIDGVVVHKTDKQISQFDIYEPIADFDDRTLYFVNRTTGKVHHVMTIEADYGQCVGYVSDWDVKTIDKG